MEGYADVRPPDEACSVVSVVPSPSDALSADAPCAVLEVAAAGALLGAAAGDLVGAASSESLSSDASSSADPVELSLDVAPEVVALPCSEAVSPV